MFSIMIGWPSVPRMCSAITRASASTAPPAGNATTMVIGRDGKVCACAPPRPQRCNQSGRQAFFISAAHRHCALMPAALMIGHHFSISAFW